MARSPGWRAPGPGLPTAVRASHQSLTAFADLVDDALRDAREVLAEAVLCAGRERRAAQAPPPRPRRVVA